MLITSDTNQSACQVCGKLPNDHYARRPALHTGYKYAKTRTNRRLIPSADDWAFKTPLLAGKLDKFASWQGKLVCVQCYQQFLDVVNQA